MTAISSHLRSNFNIIPSTIHLNKDRFFEAFPSKEDEVQIISLVRKLSLRERVFEAACVQVQRLFLHSHYPAMQTPRIICVMQGVLTTDLRNAGRIPQCSTLYTEYGVHTPLCKASGIA